MFKNLALATKIYSGFAVIGLLLVIVSFYSLTQISAIGKGIELVIQDRFPKTVAANNVLGGINEVARCMRNMLLLEKKEDIDKEAERIEAIRKKITDELNELLETVTTDRGGTIVQEILAARQAYTVPQKETIRLALEGKKSEATEILIKDVRPRQLHYFDRVDELIRYQTELMKQDGRETEVLQRNSARVIAVLSFTALVLAVVSAIFMVRGITRPINRVIVRLSDGADQVAAAAGQVSGGSQQLAEGASEQAAALEETSSSLEQMASMTRQNAGNANHADSLMEEMSKVVDKAGQLMTDLTVATKEISTASEETANIVKTIDEIAFQTSLLALNAAVEAARAGEAGSGFAIVADEVRNLAMRAAEAAKNTSHLIENTVNKTKEGAEMVQKTGEAFSQVAGSSAKVKELVGEIAAASNEQAQGVGQVSKVVVEMDKVVQQNAANAEESTSASEELSAQAEQMKGNVLDLVALIGGARGKSGIKKDMSKKVAHSSPQKIAGPRKTPPNKVKAGKGEVNKKANGHLRVQSQAEQIIPFDQEIAD